MVKLKEIIPLELMDSRDLDNAIEKIASHTCDLLIRDQSDKGYAIGRPGRDKCIRFVSNIVSVKPAYVEVSIPWSTLRRIVE